LKVFISVEPLTSAEKTQPLKPALADTKSDTFLPEVTVIPIVVSSILSTLALALVQEAELQCPFGRENLDIDPCSA
jgi:hypothetical protein